MSAAPLQMAANEASGLCIDRKRELAIRLQPLASSDWSDATSFFSTSRVGLQRHDANDHCRGAVREACCCQLLKAGICQGVNLQAGQGSLASCWRQGNSGTNFGEGQVVRVERAENRNTLV